MVAIWRGTGLADARGLKTYTENITAIVTVAMTGAVRGAAQEWGCCRRGISRNCMEALANCDPLWCELLHYRFTEGILQDKEFLETCSGGYEWDIPS